MRKYYLEMNNSVWQLQRSLINAASRNEGNGDNAASERNFLNEAIDILTSSPGQQGFVCGQGGLSATDH